MDLVKTSVLSLIFLSAPLSSLQAFTAGEEALTMVVCQDVEDALVAASKAVTKGGDSVRRFVLEEENSCFQLPAPAKIFLMKEVHKVKGKLGEVTVVEVLNHDKTTTGYVLHKDPGKDV